jgi:hypothetical protein
LSLLEKIFVGLIDDLWRMANGELESVEVVDEALNINLT